jgi:hypothetical protein
VRGESVQMPAKLWHKLGRERISPTTTGDGEHDGQRDDLALGGFLLADATDPARISPDQLIIGCSFENRVQKLGFVGHHYRTDGADQER